jgi:hypothetical protein
MVKNNDDAVWTLPQRKPITEEVLDRAIHAEEASGTESLV